MDDYILEIPDFLPSDLCASIVRRFENDSRKKHGYFYYDVNGTMVERDKMNTELMITGLEGWSDIDTLFRNYTMKAYDTYMTRLDTYFQKYNDVYHVYDRELSTRRVSFTPFPIQRIDTGGQYDWHHDGNLDAPYFVQALFYLNTLEDGDGGCTEFTNGRKVRPETGKLLVYPCSWTFLHTGGKVLRGPKYICTSTISI